MRKNNVKRILSMILAIAMSLTLCVPAFAAGNDDFRKDAMIGKPSYDEIYQTVYEQLKAQDALDMLDEYMAILAPEQNTTVFSPCGDNDEIPHMKAIYGGSVQYTYQVGYETNEVSVECMDYDNTYYYVLSPSSSSLSAKRILLAILGYVPFLSYGLTMAQEVNAIRNQAAKNSIAAARGYGQITTIYNRVTQASSSVVSGWYSYPWINVDVNRPRNVQFTAFPQHNPFQ